MTENIAGLVPRRERRAVAAAPCPTPMKRRPRTGQLSIGFTTAAARLRGLVKGSFRGHRGAQARRLAADRRRRACSARAATPRSAARNSPGASGSTARGRTSASRTARRSGASPTTADRPRARRAVPGPATARAGADLRPRRRRPGAGEPSPPAAPPRARTYVERGCCRLAAAYAMCPRATRSPSRRRRESRERDLLAVSAASVRAIRSACSPVPPYCSRPRARSADAAFGRQRTNRSRGCGARRTTSSPPSSSGNGAGACAILNAPLRATQRARDAARSAGTRSCAKLLREPGARAQPARRRSARSPRRGS